MATCDSRGGEERGGCQKEEGRNSARRRASLLNGTTITTGATKRQRREKLNKDPTAQWACSYSFAIKVKIIMLIREYINKVFNMNIVGTIYKYTLFNKSTFYSKLM